jgi:competence protein ComEA
VLEQSRGTLVVWVVAAVLATLAVLRLTAGDDGPASQPVRVARPGSGSAAGGSPEVGGSAAGGAPAVGAAAVGRGAGTLYVHVAGAVRRPGLYRISPEARVAAAIERAGGPVRRADLGGVNLAARLQDGQQVVVPLAGAVASGSGGAGAAPAGAKPSLGAATVEQLDELDGIGPTLAERIVEYRQAQGGFGSIEELGEVEGIGEKRLASLREALQP